MAGRIGKNLKELRVANHFTQEQVAKFLGISTSLYQAMEAGERTIKLKYLEKLSGLFGFDMGMIASNDQSVVDNMLVCAFRVDGLSEDDMRQIASFKEIVLNDLKLDRIIAG